VSCAYACSDAIVEGEDPCSLCLPPLLLLISGSSSPIEEQILYMTVVCTEHTEYLVVSVSEKLSSLACAMSNGKIDLWNLDQAMRDVPIQGGHVDVITSMCFLDDHQLLLSADDSGEIMAWFVRPNRWKGQLAFQLKTPSAREGGTPTLARQASAMPIPSYSSSSETMRSILLSATNGGGARHHSTTAAIVKRQLNNLDPKSALAASMRPEEEKNVDPITLISGMSK
jgi:WD40 repeat protein